MIVLDSGVLYAIADADDRHHRSCVDLIAAEVGRLVVPAPVIVETAWMIESRLGPSVEAAFVDSLVGGELERADLIDEDWRRLSELVRRYADLGLGTVDASVVAIAEHLDVERLVTVDRRHFSVVRPRHRDAFVLLPN